MPPGILERRLARRVSRFTTTSVNGDAPPNLFPALQLHAPGHSLPVDGLSDAVGEAGFSHNEADQQRLEEVIADCTESIRLDPENSRQYLERAEARTSFDCYEEAVVDYNRAIQFDSCNAAAYIGRCPAKSELERHEEAIADYDQAVRLDQDAASASGNWRTRGRAVLPAQSGHIAHDTPLSPGYDPRRQARSPFRVLALRPSLLAQPSTWPLTT